MSLFPVFVKLEGRPVLLVGAGPIAESKLGGLLSARASVTVVAPRATPAIVKWASEGTVRWDARDFQPGDLDGVALVVAAVPASVAAYIYREAQARGILCNSVDDPENCDFFYPAVVSRGDLQIAISTAGHSPALAQRLRVELEQQFGPEYADWVEQLGEARREMFAGEMDPEVRRERLHEIAGATAFQAFSESLPRRPPSSARDPWRTGPRRSVAEAGRATELRDGGREGGKVYLVGAGPGDPELLTLKALRILGQADVVLHDDLLTPELLELIPASARVECVGKRHGERHVTQEDINRRLCDYAVAGKTVVRLKGGDGAIFGRASEEMDALRARQVPFSIVPGVTAASSAAAAAGVSLTDRRLGSTLVFLTAQRCKGNPPPKWKAIAGLGGTAAIYMPGGHEDDLARDLIEAGLAPETPCFVVANASRPDQQIVETTLVELPGLSKLPAPALLLVGVLPAVSGDSTASIQNAREKNNNH
jgi:uroporphyrin-III C-methyltransferase/precorrin-2 dehydrogenase/sirohydrochlorin ferrochelatase